jgi:hypothetical protein
VAPAAGPGARELVRIDPAVGAQGPAGEAALVPGATYELRIRPPGARGRAGDAAVSPGPGPGPGWTLSIEVASDARWLELGPVLDRGRRGRATGDRMLAARFLEAEGYLFASHAAYVELVRDLIARGAAGSSLVWLLQRVAALSTLLGEFEEARRAQEALAGAAPPGGPPGEPPGGSGR